MRKIIGIICGSCVLIGCLPFLNSHEGRMNELGGALMQLTDSVEGTVRYEEIPEGLLGNDLLRYATEEEPRLLEPFKDFHVMVRIVDKHADMLVCSKDGKFGLLEDTACKSGVDRNLWSEPGQHPCTFVIDVEETCRSPR